MSSSVSSSTTNALSRSASTAVMAALRSWFRLRRTTTRQITTNKNQLVPGPKNTGQWNNILPVIAEFISDDLQQINELKLRVPDAEWKRCYAMGLQYLQTFPGRWRDGRPFFASMQLADAQKYDRDLKRAQKNRMTFLGVGSASVASLLFCCGIGLQVVGAMRRPAKLARLAIPAAEQFQNPQPQPPPPPAAEPLNPQKLAGQLIDRAFPPDRHQPPPLGQEVLAPVPDAPPDEFAPTTLQPIPPSPAETPTRPQPPEPELTPRTAPNWQPGAKAYAQWGASWDEVRILQVHPNGNVTIRWVRWGPQWDQAVLGSQLREEPPESAARPFSAMSRPEDEPGVEIGANTRLRIGDRVYVRSSGQWTAGTITAIRSPQTVMVRTDQAGPAGRRSGERPYPRRMLRLAVEAATVSKKDVPSSTSGTRHRTWTDATGKFKTQARFVALRGGTVVLEKDDGATLEIELERLSPADQQYARSQSDTK
jgi:hypothetical protein